jgi:hypothetical protein
MPKKTTKPNSKAKPKPRPKAQPKKQEQQGVSPFEFLGKGIKLSAQGWKTIGKAGIKGYRCGAEKLKKSMQGGKNDE